VELADGFIEAAQGRRARAPRAHRCTGSPDGLVVGLAPATLEFWVRFPNERNQGKQAHPVFKYRVPQGSQPSEGLRPGRLGHGDRDSDKKP
jgi:hypothetical protein